MQTTNPMLDIQVYETYRDVIIISNYSIKDFDQDFYQPIFLPTKFSTVGGYSDTFRYHYFERGLNRNMNISSYEHNISIFL